ncbi:MAG: DNA-3-methyladenine glycosylase [Propioniciclava sp.]
MTGSPLDFDAPSPVVARLLLGCILWAGPVGVRLVEVEAYEGEQDPASHAYRGPTARNRSMFGPGGHLYVYSMHGHACANAVCGPEQVARGVLMRAGEVVAGLELARERRPGVRDAWLARGPGNLTRALGLTRADDGADLLVPDPQRTGGAIRLAPRTGRPSICTGPRVNVPRAKSRPWRFVVAGSPSVSLPRLTASAPDRARG